MIASPEQFCADIRQQLSHAGLYAENDSNPAYHWRISPEPFPLNVKEVEFLEALGNHLLRWYQAVNQLYLESVKGNLPSWVAQYLDQGKPGDLIDFSRMKRFRNLVPGILRPDLIVTENGFAMTELDSVPGGFGLTAGMMTCYDDDRWNLIGQPEGLSDHFYRMVEDVAGISGCTTAIVVSDEARDYLPEMRYLSRELRGKGHPVYTVHPRELIFQEEGLFIEMEGRKVDLEVIYRFYELFDLKNIPKSELVMYALKKGRVKTTPPYKPYQEEKLIFALFHHPALRPWWEKELGSETFETLNHLIPSTWILDNRPLPPHATVPGLKFQGKAVCDWTELENLTQKERELVLKPSGFSEWAWGGRGVVVGHDVSGEDWKQALQKGLDDFEIRPHILQKFHKGKRQKVTYWDPGSQNLKTMESRVRLTPYYFVYENAAHIGGALATLCPQDKKKIHGMVDAVMVPCGVRSQ